MIRFNGVSKAYLGGKPALQGVSFHIPEGSMCYLTGHSGAGKSTLLKLIMGMERLSTGEIHFKGHDISRLKRQQIPFLRREIGMVHQDYRLLVDRNVIDNVCLPLIIRGMDPIEAKRRASSALDKVGLLARANHLPIHLSGGEQQRIDIARAVVGRPQLLLADEPTGNLDSVLSLEIFNLFEEFNRLGMTILLATHDHELVVKKPKPTLILEYGHLVSFK